MAEDLVESADAVREDRVLRSWRSVMFPPVGTASGAAVFIQRLFTSYLPPIWGWAVLVWMRRKEYL